MLKNVFLSAIFVFTTLFCEQSFAINSMYALASKQITLSKNHDRIADIVANVDTTAYKSEKDVNIEVLKRPEIDQKTSFAGIGTTVRDYSQGPLIATGRKLDIAINGDGYFMAETPRGIRYTRAGNLKITSEGTLATKEGYPLIGPGGGQIEFAEGDFDIKITDDGLVRSGIEERGQIGVFSFENNQALIREGESLYRTNQTPQPTEEAVIVQGMLEGSNVNPVLAMTNMIEVSRGIERVKKMQNELGDLQTRTIRTLKDR